MLAPALAFGLVILTMWVLLGWYVLEQPREVLARLAHGLFYIADLARPRSLAWLLGIGCVMYLFLLAGRLL